VRVPPQNLILLALLLGLLLIFIQLGLLSVAFAKLGLSGDSAFLLLAVSLLGSWINLPLFTIRGGPNAPVPNLPPPLDSVFRMPRRLIPGRVLVALNVGGAVVPIAFSAYLFRLHDLPLTDIALGITGVAAISHMFSRPVPGVGIGMPILIAPVTAALAAMLINPDNPAPLAYISGTLGVLIGADILRLKDVRHMGSPLAAIGGAGTFDGIFITGLVAVLLT
jgi:uncharacterized membrane protein